MAGTNPLLVNLIADSVNYATGVRLCTFQLIDVPKFVLFDISRHRTFSFSVESSRAIPVKKLVERVRNETFIPEVWGSNQAGMGEGAPLSEDDSIQANHAWGYAARACANVSEELAGLNVHKHHANRPMDWIAPISFIFTSCNAGIENFLKLRLPYGVQPELRFIASRAQELYDTSEPKVLEPGDWHLPFITQEDWDEHRDVTALRIISAARCARTSYARMGEVFPFEKDRELVYDRLVKYGHWSPLEHQAMALSVAQVQNDRWDYYVTGEQSILSNFHPCWKQWRKLFRDESGAKREDGVWKDPKFLVRPVKTKLR